VELGGQQDGRDGAVEVPTSAVGPAHRAVREHADVEVLVLGLVVELALAGQVRRTRRPGRPDRDMVEVADPVRAAGETARPASSR
jgi:hypothetical protein